MPDTPRFGVRFKDRPTDEQPSGSEDGDAQRSDPVRVPIYHRAVELAACAHTIVELAESERFFLRDQLDRKSSLIPQLIAQGLAIADMPARRELYRQARRALTDCATIFDMMLARGSVSRDAVGGARARARALLDELLPLTIEPPRVW
ncbi:MAG TPA: four helix bundle protein [Kofleriaceae bacterium]